MSTSPLPGQRYRHYKGGLYEVVSLATIEATLEPAVVYRAEKDGTIWVRPLTNWQESVTIDGASQPRFALIA